MRDLVLIAVFVLLAVPAAQAQSSDCDCEVVQNTVQTQAKKSTRKARTAPASGISRQDRENLDRAMSRNVLQSIEGELRRKRIGN